MDISSIKPVVHPFCWLQGQVADLGKTGGGMDELFLGRAFTGEEPHQVGLSAEALDHLSEHLQALLFVHRARIEEHDLIRGDADLLAIAIGATGGTALGLNGLEINPVGKQLAAAGGHTFAVQALQHRLGDAAHHREALQGVPLPTLGNRAQPTPLEQAKLEGSIQFKILDMQPADTLPAHHAAQQQGSGCTEKRRGHGDHHIRTPSPLREQGHKAGESEAGEMQQALEPAGLARHPEGAALHPNPFTLLQAKAVVMTCCDLPSGEIGRRCDHTHAMATGR